MKIGKKYIGLFTFVWLLGYMIFDELGSLTAITFPQNIILLINALFSVSFLSFFFVLLSRKIPQKITTWCETLFISIGLLFSIALLAYHFSNTWLWQEANTTEFILEIARVSMLFVAILFAAIFHFIIREQTDMSYPKMWNTPKIFDLAFWGVFCITAFGLGTSVSKIIPYTNRNYFEYLRIAFVLAILLAAILKSRFFVSQRGLFYSVLIGYLIACGFEACVALFVFNPLLNQQLINIGISSTRITVSNVFTCINLAVVALWVGWDLYQEKRLFSQTKA